MKYSNINQTNKFSSQIQYKKHICSSLGSWTNSILANIYKYTCSSYRMEWTVHSKVSHELFVFVFRTLYLGSALMCNQYWRFTLDYESSLSRPASKIHILINCRHLNLTPKIPSDENYTVYMYTKVPLICLIHSCCICLIVSLKYMYSRIYIFDCFINTSTMATTKVVRHVTDILKITCIYNFIHDKVTVLILSDSIYSSTDHMMLFWV